MNCTSVIRLHNFVGTSNPGITRLVLVHAIVSVTPNNEHARVKLIDGDYIDAFETATDIELLIIATLAPEPAWIPVAERQPDNDRHVLILTKAEEVMFGWYDRYRGKRKKWFMEDGHPEQVTHWFDVPRLPGGRKLLRAGLTHTGGCTHGEQSNR